MRITPNHPRLRSIAIACWTFGGWWIVQIGLFNISFAPRTQILLIAMALTGVIAFALGIAFWLLGTDRRAGIVFDSKGLTLNLGHSAAFIAWENIAAVGVSTHRPSLLALGSTHQFGIKLRDPQAYIQSYEERLPASQSIMGWAIQILKQLLQPFSQRSSAPTHDDLARMRAQSGYDVLVPETLLGGKATAFVEMVQVYCYNPRQRQLLTIE